MKHPTIDELTELQARCRAKLPTLESEYLRVESRLSVGGCGTEASHSISIYHDDGYSGHASTIAEAESAFCDSLNPERTLAKIKELRKEADALEARLQPEAA